MPSGCLLFGPNEGTAVLFDYALNVLNVVSICFAINAYTKANRAKKKLDETLSRIHTSLVETQKRRKDDVDS